MKINFSILCIIQMMIMTTAFSQISVKDFKKIADTIPPYFKFPYGAFFDPSGKYERDYSNFNKNFIKGVDYVDEINTRPVQKKNGLITTTVQQPVIGLKPIFLNHSEIQSKAAKVLKSGDIVLTYRPLEWSNAGGAYTKMQMGVSHAGLIYFDGSILKNIDSPLNAEYLGSLDSDHYKNDTKFLHVIRPRLNSAQRVNINKWSKIFADNNKTIYTVNSDLAFPVARGRLAFNPDYGSPIYSEPKAGASEDLNFVETLGLIALSAKNSQGITLPPTGLRMYCSEFAWAVLSLKNCNPDDEKVRQEFIKLSKVDKTPSCIEMAFKPMNVLSKTKKIGSFEKVEYIGLTEGPIAIIDLHMGLGLGKRKRDAKRRQNLIDRVFENDDDFENEARLSPGHREVSKNMAPFFTAVEGLYDSGRYAFAEDKAALLDQFNGAIKPNYGPSSYILNTLLEGRNPLRTMDYVGTIVFTENVARQ